MTVACACHRTAPPESQAPAFPQAIGHSVGAAPHSQRGLIEKILPGLSGVILVAFVILIVIAIAVIRLGQRHRIATLPDRHTVFVGKIRRVHLVAVGNHGFVSDLLFRRIIHGIVPFEAQPLYREPVQNRDEADAAFNRIVDTVMRRMRRSDDSLYREYNQNEGFQGNFRNLLRQIIDDQDYREVVDNQNDI